MSESDEWSARLERDGFVVRHRDAALRTTKQWHAALARAAHRLYQSGAELVDMRTPIAAVLVERYAEMSDDDLAEAVCMMLQIAKREFHSIEVTQR